MASPAESQIDLSETATWLTRPLVGFKSGALNEDRRMDDRAFDEDFARDGRRRLQTVEPMFVDAKSRGDVGARKAAHQTADKGDIGVLMQECGLMSQPVGVRDVIGIHPGDEGTRGVFDSGIERVDEPASPR